MCIENIKRQRICQAKVKTALGSAITYNKRMLKVSEWTGDLNELLSAHRELQDTTLRLGNIRRLPSNLNQGNDNVLRTIYKHTRSGKKITQILHSLTKIPHGSHRDSEGVLRSLLRLSGIDLTMASMLLRFQNPETFQIIDRHVYRAAYGRPYPLTTSSPVDNKISLYFSYLDDMIALVKTRNVEYSNIDRILCIFDKIYNGVL